MRARRRRCSGPLKANVPEHSSHDHTYIWRPFARRAAQRCARSMRMPDLRARAHLQRAYVTRSTRDAKRFMSEERAPGGELIYY